MLFAIPWHDRVLVGTTDTPVGEVASEPRPLRRGDRLSARYLDRYLDTPAGDGDVLSTFAGLRPLLRGARRRDTAKLSREHAVIVSDSGLVTITGGKWTTYRRMATDAVDRAMQVGRLAPTASATPTLKLHGWREPERVDENCCLRLTVQMPPRSPRFAMSTKSGAGCSTRRCPILLERPSGPRATRRLAV